MTDIGNQPYRYKPMTKQTFLNAISTKQIYANLGQKVITGKAQNLSNLIFVLVIIYKNLLAKRC